MPAAYASAAGATPNEITSARESSSRPSAECSLRERATLPSKTSKTKAHGASAAARKKWTGARLSTYSMARKTAPTPHAALPRVRKSARWNSRIIEKWRGRSIAHLEQKGVGFVPVDILAALKGRNSYGGSGKHALLRASAGSCFDGAAGDRGRQLVLRTP